jgi:hypothetical protein
MEITVRGLWTLIHGMGFGALYLLACSGALVELYRFTTSSAPSEFTPDRGRFLKFYLITMVVLAWAAVLSGAYVIYPWYRATPPPGTADLSMFPQRLLLSKATTAGWHTLGMEWKEHVAWMAPIAMTMVAYVLTAHHGVVREQRGVRRAVVMFALVALVAAGVAGFFGAMIDKNAPIEGGRTVDLMGSSK